MQKLAAGAIAEFLGTFALVFFGAGSIILTQVPGSGAGLLTVALAHGLVLVVFVSSAMAISGGQLNPAVSVGLVVAGKQDVRTAGAYIAAQLVAAASGAGMLVFIFSRSEGGAEHVEAARLGATLGSFSDAGNVVGVLVFEIVMTFALMHVVLRCLVDDRAHRLGGIPVGAVVAACILLAGPLTGASMNPARSFGPALYGHWTMHWAYWLAPLVGACAAALLERMVFDRDRAAQGGGGAA